MPILLAIACLGSLTASTAADFFPMPAKATWDYESTGYRAGLYRQEVGEPVDVNGEMQSPMQVVIGGKVIQTTFYQVSSGGVFVLGSKPKSFFERPQPVFQFDEKGTSWIFDGPSPYEADKEAGMNIKGQSKVIGQRNILGERRECLEVKTETRIGLSMATATVYKQTAIYAKGVGLAELEETILLGKSSHKSKTKLLKFTLAKVDGQ